ncbi:hypothetical protein P5V15_015307 [Pogonomyrmex californicus]
MAQVINDGPSHEAREGKSMIIKDQIVKNNIIDLRELFFLRKDNLTYFVDTSGKPLDSDSQKLFERNELPKLSNLTLGEARVIKYKNYYHLILTVSEEQRGPTITLTQITLALMNVRKLIDELKLETISIAKIEMINNVPRSNIKARIQLIFINVPTKLIICWINKILPKISAQI